MFTALTMLDVFIALMLMVHFAAESLQLTGMS